MRIDVAFACGLTAVLCLLLGLLLGRVLWAGDSGDRALACLSAALPAETAPDDCYQIRAMLKRESSKTDLARTGIKLIQGAEDTMEALTISLAIKESKKHKPPWIGRMLRRFWESDAD